VLTIAITGASGFIGAALAEHLKQRGDRILPLVRPGHGVDGGIHWDPTGGTIDQRALEGVDAIVHLAGENVADGRWTEEKKRRIRESRVRGTSLLARTLATMRQKPRVLVSGSAVGFYGSRDDAPIDETASRGNDFLAEVTESWEQAALPAAEAGVRVVHPRTGIVLAPHGGALGKMLLPFKLGVGGKIGEGRQYMSWIALEDAVRALVHAVDADSLRGPFNLTAPNPVTNGDFTRALGRALRRPTALTVPSFAARLAFGEMADAALLAGARALPRRLLESGFTFRHPELEPYLRALFVSS
jgi:uncharacterized protein